MSKLSRGWLVLVFVFLIAPAPSATAQAPSQIRYRRVLVPQDELASQIRGLLPLKRDEFDRRLRAAEADVKAASPALVRIERGQFVARFEAGQLRGAVELEIVATGGEPALLDLGPCNVALAAAAWTEPQASAAVLGIDPAGALRCLVPHSGVLHCEWTAQAVESQPQQSVFLLRLPSAPRRTLEITAPADIEWSLDDGIVAGQSMADGSGLRRSILELTGASEIRLLARQASAAPNSASRLAVRESSQYTVLSSAIDLETTLELDLPVLQGGQLQLLADPGLHVTAVQQGGERIAFSSHEVVESGATSIGIELASAAAGPESTLQISATADWLSDSRTRLPRITVDGGVLQEGRATVSAPAWLRLQARPLTDSIMSAAIPASAGRANDQFQFQIFGSASSIEIASDQSPPPLREDSGLQLTFEPTQVKGVLIANLSTLESDRFVVEANIPRNWIVDSVEIDPPEALADRALAPRGQNQQLLRLNLARPLTLARPLQLIIRAHARRPANGQPLPSEFFTLATVAGVREFRRVVAIEFEEPGAELTLAKAEGLTRLNPEQLSVSDKQLFESPPRAMVVELTDANRVLRGTLTAAAARYRADVLVTATTDAAGWKERIVARCEPEASPVNSVLVRLAPCPAVPVSWHVVGAGHDVIAAIEVPLPEASGTEAAAVVYRLNLPRSRTAPFELVGEWTIPGSPSGGPEGEVSLAWLPEAGVQTGIAELHVAGSENLLLAAEELQALPVAAAADSFTTLRARYRYDASRGARLRFQPAPPSATQRGAWIDELHLASYFSKDGSSQHEATFRVVNAGLRELQVAFKSEVADLRLVDDSGHEQRLPAAALDREFRIPLPAGDRSPTVRLRYSAIMPGSRGWLRSNLVAPIPHSDLPTLARQWTVALPPGFQPANRRQFTPRGDSSTGQTNQESAVRNLLGFLAGPAWGRSLFASRTPSESSPASDPSFAAWTFVNGELTDAPTASVTVYQPNFLAVWSLCLTLAAAAIAVILVIRARWLVPAAAMCAAVALVASPVLAGPLLGIGGGLLFGALWLLLRPQTVVGSPAAIRPLPPTTFVGQAASAVGLLLLIAGPAAALYAAPDDMAPPLASPLPRVIVPVDGDQQPAGEYVYLESALYDALHRLTDTHPAALAPWLLEQARYEFPAAARVEGAAAVLDELRAVYEFHTLLPGAILRLPLVRDQIVLREGLVLLDGRPAKPAWEPAGDALTLPVESPGQHRLELSLGAIGRLAPNAILVDLTVPRAAQTLIAPPAGNGRIVEPGTGPAADTAPVVLAATNRLAIRWPRQHDSDSISGGLFADQLLWWKIRPGSVVVEGMFRLQPVGGAIHEAVIAVDPRLRLLPGALAAGRITTLEEGSRQLVKVQFAEPAAGPVNLRLSWLWPDVSGLGDLFLPQVRVEADRVDRQWIAMSCDPGLVVEGPAAAEFVGAADFLQAWGEVASPPSIVFVDSAAVASTPIALRPEVRLPHAEQSIEWSLTGAAASARVAIRIRDVAATRLEHRLTIPPQLRVTSVRLLQGGRAAPVRWVQQSDGTLNVTLFEPAAPEQELTVTADLPLPRQRQRLPLAEVRLQEAAIDSSTMRIFRHSDVAVSLQSLAGWTEQDAGAVGVYRPGLGRLVAALRNEAAIGNTQPVVSRQVNQPRVAGHAFIRTQEADGEWRGEVELDVNVAAGVLDELRLEVPDAWAAPLQLDPPLDHRFENLPGQRQRLVIRPPRAIAERLQLSIRGPLVSGDAGFTAPDVVLLDAPAVERIVLLDRGHAGQRIDWETTGLIAADRSTIELPPHWHGLEGELLRAVAPRFDAAAHPRQETASTPLSPLAIVSARLGEDRRAAAVARYIIRPAGARSLRCLLPADSRLVQVLVDDVAVTCTSSGPRLWNIATPSTSLPFELTIAYDGTLPVSQTSRAARKLAAPHLVDLRVDRILWDVTLADSRLSLRDHFAAAASAEEVALLRLEAIASALEDVVTAAAGNVLHSVLTQSAGRWRLASNQALDALPRFEAGNSDIERDRASRRDAARERVARAHQRLSALGLTAKDTTSPTDAANFSPPAIAGQVLSTGPSDELTITLHDAAADRSLVASASAFVLVGLAVFAGPAVRLRPCRDWLVAHAPLLVALAGLAWWLLAPFGWLGWLPVLAAIWSSLHFPRTPGPADSTWARSRAPEPTR